MPEHVIVQHAIHGKSGLAQDRYVNTFHLDTGVVPNTFPEIALLFPTFWSSVPTGESFGLKTLMSPLLNGVPATVSFYAQSDPKPRTPRYVYQYTFSTVTTNTPLPSEVAICLSYRARVVSGQNKARRRGRIYLGPLSNAPINNVNPGSDAGLEDNIGSIITKAAAEFCAKLNTAGAKWVVWSEMDQAMNEIEVFSVDNAFDTQRRRGMAPSAVTTATVVQTP